MPRVRVAAFSISLDGYGAGPDQSLENPMGVGAMGLHRWVLGTRTFKRMHVDASADGSTGVDDDFAAAGFENVSQGGVMLKILADFQMDQLIDKGMLKDQHIDALYSLGLEYPDLCGSLFSVCKIKS